MKTITIEITEQQAHKWRVVLTDFIKRNTGNKLSEWASLDRIIYNSLLVAVASELTQQVTEAEAAMEEAK